MIDLGSYDYRNNPYPHYQQMRAEYPVYPLKKPGCWAISRYNDVKKILKNHELFSSADISEEPRMLQYDFLFSTRGMVGADKPDHTRLRQLLNKIFPQFKISNLEPIIRQCCLQLLKAIKNQTPVNIVQSFCAPLPIMVMSKILGLDEEKKETFRYWILILLTWRLQHYPNKESCIHNMFHYLTELIIEKKKET